MPNLIKINHFISLKRSHMKSAPYKFGSYNETLYFLNNIILLCFLSSFGFCVLFCFVFYFYYMNIQCYIILGGRWQLSLRHDKISRNTPLAVPHCFNIVLFNKKMTPSAWMTTPKWTINILYIEKS